MNGKSKKNNIPENWNEIYSEEVMDMLYQRREAHRKGMSKSYTPEESISIIKNIGGKIGISSMNTKM